MHLYFLLSEGLNRCGHSIWIKITLNRTDYGAFMSKKLKSNEWIELFNLYESNNFKNLWIVYPKYKTVSNSTKWWFKQKYKKFYTIIKIWIH